jgi:hypothetical protein
LTSAVLPRDDFVLCEAALTDVRATFLDFETVLRCATVVVSLNCWESPSSELLSGYRRASASAAAKIQRSGKVGGLRKDSGLSGFAESAKVAC